MSRKLIAAWLGCMALSAASAASAPMPVRGCATYSSSGKLAAFTIRAGRNLSVTVDDATSTVSMSLPFTARGCTAFFSQGNDLVAVGLDVALRDSRDVNLVVLDPNAMTWVTPKPISFRVAADSRGPLLGFVGGTHTLLMMQPGEYSASAERTPVFLVQIDPFEHKAKTSALAVAGKYVPGVSVVPDLAKGTLWLVQGERGDCELRAYGADGSSQHGSMPLSYSDCPSAELVVAAAGGTLLKLENENDTLAVHVLERKGSPVRIAGDASGDRFWYSGRSALSADGGVLAISVKRVHRSQWGGERITDEVVVLETSTSKVLGHIPFRHSPEQFAVAGSRDSSTLSWLEASGWTSRTLPRAGH